jgi:hypothetical protein
VTKKKQERSGREAKQKIKLESSSSSGDVLFSSIQIAYEKNLI